MGAASPITTVQKRAAPKVAAASAETAVFPPSRLEHLPSSVLFDPRGDCIRRDGSDTANMRMERVLDAMQAQLNEMRGILHDARAAKAARNVRKRRRSARPG